MTFKTESRLNRKIGFILASAPQVKVHVDGLCVFFSSFFWNLENFYPTSLDPPWNIKYIVEA